MTDNKIIKALEWHSNDETHCSACPYEEYSVTHYCVDMVIKDALDLINRQKAEIEKLEKGSLKEAMTFNSKTIANIRAEAVKEFAEDFKREYFLNGLIHTTSISDSCIDDFVEEFLTRTAGETNAE